MEKDYRFQVHPLLPLDVMVTGKKTWKITYRVTTRGNRRPSIPEESVRKYESLEKEASSTGHGGMTLLMSQYTLNPTENSRNKTQAFWMDDKGVLRENITPPGAKSAITSTFRALGYNSIGSLFVREEYAKIKKIVLEFIPFSIEQCRKNVSNWPDDWTDNQKECVLHAMWGGGEVVFGWVQRNKRYFFNFMTMEVRVHNGNWASLIEEGMHVYEDCVQSRLVLKLGHIDGYKYVFLHSIFLNVC